jgi:hypothetical protein
LKTAIQQVTIGDLIELFAKAAVAFLVIALVVVGIVFAVWLAARLA